MSASTWKCKVCGCTNEDCRNCIEKTGKACHWVEEDLCSACEKEYDESHPRIQGYYGCDCHPFKSWEDLKYHQKKKLKPGDIVKHRCTQREGVILGNTKETVYPSNLKEPSYEITKKNWYEIKYGELPKDHEIINVENAIIISND